MACQYPGPVLPLRLLSQLYDWLIVNKVAVKEMLCSYDPDKTGTIETEDFFSSLSGMGMPLTEEGRTKLLAVYDKKGEGKMNYNDLLADHKYIHAVSLGYMHEVVN